jgi:2-polyprenyl-3-methyl-5-hydroxy-6-metoxy-1,4-benzoquinol methylase
MKHACVVCGSSRAPRFREVLADFTTRTCPECGFVTGVFPIRRGPDDYERIDMARYQESIGVMRRTEAKELVRLVTRQSPAEKTWYDVGCGIGSVLKEALNADYTISGAEPDALARRVASESLEGARLDTTFDAKSVPDESQGVISMLDVLEHIAPEQLRGMARLVRLKLVPGGYWLLKVPSTDGLFYRLAQAAAAISRRAASPVIRRLWLMNNVSPHRVYFREATLRRFVIRNGFEPVEVRYLNAVPTGTILSRLRLDDTIPEWLSIGLAAPIAALNIVERTQRKTDSLVLLARKASSDLSDGSTNAAAELFVAQAE